MAVAAAAGAWVAANAATISAATAAISTVAQGVQARNQAQAQEEYRKQQNEMAIESMQDQYGQISEAEADARERAAQESINNQEQYAQRKARINLMAAASGTQGLSVDSMMRDLKQQKGRNMNTIITNQDIELQGFRNQAEQVRTGTAGRIDTREIKRPSWAAIGLQTAQAGTQGFLRGKAMENALSGGGNPEATLQSNSNSYGALQSGVDYSASNQVMGGV